MDTRILGFVKAKYNPKQVRIGIKVEKEHTDDSKVAEKIAKDHLREDPKYYDKLLIMEGKGKYSELEKKILDWFKKNPKPTDEQVHAFAEKNGIKPDKLEEMIYRLTAEHAKMVKAVIPAAMQHPDVPGAGIKKRKRLSPQDKFNTVMAEFERGTLRDGQGNIVVDRSKALAIAYAEMHKSVVFFKGKRVGIGHISAGGYKKVAEGEFVKVSTKKKTGKKVKEEDKKKRKTIPEELKDRETRRITYEIVKRGRKYFSVRMPGKQFIAKMLITPEIEKYEVGKTYDLDVIVDAKRTQYGLTIKAYPVSEQMKQEREKKLEQEKIRKEEEAAKIEKYIPSGNYWNGKIYGSERYGYRIYIDNKEVGISRAQANYLEKNRNEVIAKMKNSPANVEANIKRYLGYMEEAAGQGRIYQNGLDKLRGWGIDKMPEYKEKLEVILSQAENNRERQAKAKEKQVMEEMGDDKGPAIGRYLKVMDSVPLNVPVKSGDKIIVYTGSKGKRWFPAEDAPSFGLGFEGTYAANYYYREATKEEKKQYEKKQKELRERKERETTLRAAKDALRKKIMGEGQIPREKKGEQIRIDGKRYFDTQNIYGGGEWFEVTKDAVWYIENHGMDGDDWSMNNVRTGGAGAIGWKIPYSKDVVEELEKLSREEKTLKEEKFNKSKKIVFFKAKYRKRTGTPGHYRYYYDEPKGKRKRVVNVSGKAQVKSLEEKWEGMGVKVDLYFNKKGNIELSKVIVPKEKRGQGLGTKFMNELTKKADSIGATITLTPTKDFGGYVGKLNEFYKRFGFVENKGKNKDYEIKDTMYRLPKIGIKI